eukprot:m.141704 g.141704  ORF g.141704 m.141704 type:complete len:345 (-) comp30206_c0_seq1:76-1110(-)
MSMCTYRLRTMSMHTCLWVRNVCWPNLLSLGLKSGTTGNKSAPRVGDTMRGPQSESVHTKTVGEDSVAGANLDDMPTVSVQRLLVRNGNLQMTITRSRDINHLADLIVTTASNLGGYVTSRSSNSANHNVNPKGCGPNASDTCVLIVVTLKVPVASFDKLVETIKSAVTIAEISTYSDTATDVTSKYVDAAARAAGLNATHSRLLALMRRADTVADVLKVQQELQIVEQELEVKKAIMKTLSNDAAFSTLRVTIEPKKEFKAYVPFVAPPPPPPPFWSPIKTFSKATSDVTKLFIKMADVLIYGVVFLLPIVFCIGLLMMIVMKACSCCGGRAPCDKFAQPMCA